MFAQSNHQYELLDTLPIGVCIIDDQSRILVWNDLLVKWTALAEHEVVGVKLATLYPELASTMFLERLANLFKDGIPIVFSAAVHRYFLPIPQLEADKSVFMLQQTVIRLLPENPPRAMICIEDVSASYSQLSHLRNEVKERKSKEKLLKQRNQTLRIITQLQTNIIKQVTHEDFYQQMLGEFKNLFETKIMMVLKASNKSDGPQNPSELTVTNTINGVHNAVCPKYLLRAWYDQNEQQEQFQTKLEVCFAEQTEKIARCIQEHFYSKEIHQGIISKSELEETGLVLEKFQHFLSIPINIGEEVQALIVISTIDLKIEQETLDLLTPVVTTIGQLIRTRRAESQRASAMLELKLNAQRLEAAKSEAESATRTKSEFLANMSHEIRTPMTAIIGFTEVLMEHDLTEEEFKSTISIIHKNGEHLLSLINDILDISKIEAGKMSLEKIRFSPVEEAQQILDLMRSRADKKMLSLDMVVMQPVPALILTDPTRYRQVLVNLIGNAIKFTPQGFVRLVISVNYPNKINSDPVLKLSVQDTGIGIPQDKLGRIFECFSQADNSTTREFGGTGLGLSISRKICQMMGGDLNVISEAGKGSTFTATFKLDAITVQEELPDHKFLASGGVISAATISDVNASVVKMSNLNVLVVEDAADNRRLIDFILNKIGIHAQFAENGQEALTMVDESQKLGSIYHIIFMDMHMPVMDGLTAASILRNEGYSGKIIALTANAMPQDRIKCMESGCNDFLTKPINRKKLEEVVTQHATMLLQQEKIPVDTF